MSNFNRFKKNAENYRLNEIYRNMTPEQYKEGIRLAIYNTQEKMARDYERNLNKIQEHANNEMQKGVRLAIDTISVELLYELGNQLGCFEENAEYLQEKIEKVQDIYRNTMSAIEKYTKYKKDNQARRDFEKKKNKVEKMFSIRF